MARGVIGMGKTRPLIGVEDIDVPRWAKGYAATANAGLRIMASKVLETVGLAVGWAWHCSPRSRWSPASTWPSPEA
jgi:hypothetical protein